MATEEDIQRVRDFVSVLQGSGAPHQQGIARDITAVLDSLVSIETLRAARDTAIANALAAIDARDVARAEVTKLTEMLDRATNPTTFEIGTVKRVSDDGGSTFDSVKSTDYDAGTVVDAGASQDEAPASQEPEKKN